MLLASRGYKFECCCNYSINSHPAADVTSAGLEPYHTPTYPQGGCCKHSFQNVLLIRVRKHFNLPSSPPPTRGSGKERLIGQRRTWTCLETVLWSESSQRCQDVSSSVHTNRHWSTLKHHSRIRRNSRGSTNLCKFTEASRSNQNTTGSFWCISL